MDSVHFRFMGSDITYGGIYVGFGLFVTAALLLAAFIAWHLGGLAPDEPPCDRRVGLGAFRIQHGEPRLRLDLLLRRPYRNFGPDRGLSRCGCLAGEGSEVMIYSRLRGAD